MASLGELISSATQKLSKYIQFKIEYYRDKGITAGVAQENAYFLIYDISNNHLLENINYPVENIPKQIIHNNGEKIAE